MTWQENAPHARPDRQRRPSKSVCATARYQDPGTREALLDTSSRVGQAEAVLAPDEQCPEQGTAERLLADRLIVEAILEEGLGGPRHQELERELIRYAVPVLRQLLADGQIIGKAARLGRPPVGSEAWLDFTGAVREEFARDMVADALPVFTRAVFGDRRWSPSRGASLKTYFVNACILQFAALYRKWLDQQRSVRPAGLQVDPAGEAGIDPAAEAALRDEASRVLKQIKDPQTRQMLALRAVGYTAEDAARRAGLTPKAAEGRLARLRKALKTERDSTVPPSTRRPDTSQGGRWAQ